MGSKDLLSAHDVVWNAAVDTDRLLLVLESETSTWVLILEYLQNVYRHGAGPGACII